MRIFLNKLICIILLFTAVVTGRAIEYTPNNVCASLALKEPGNIARVYQLNLHPVENGFLWKASEPLPVTIRQNVTEQSGKKKLTVTITTEKTVYFNFGEKVKTGYVHNNCLFYMPGFWYRRNLRSPKEAPSFYTSDSWTVREDRLSTPLTAIYDEKSHKVASVIRLADYHTDALTALKSGEVILSGKTSLGYTGFKNDNGNASLVFGFPYKEEPKTYIRKLTLDPSVEAFQKLQKGDTLSLSWELYETPASDFSKCVRQMWEYSYDTYHPSVVTTSYTPEIMKRVMSNYFVESFVGDKPLNYFSSAEMEVSTCNNRSVAEVGFVGRTLLNAFNALEYGELMHRTDLTGRAHKIFDSYLKNGFSKAGFFDEAVHYDRPYDTCLHSIRRQSEGVYAMLYYLNYEKQQGRRHPEWELKMKTILNQFLKLQNEDGSFPRKFNDDFSVVDKSGGSTPSATLPLVMGYKYFGDKKYLRCAVKTVDYLDKEIISKSDYFSSTLDANCEDKEASLYASTAAYYLALATKGKVRDRYAVLARKAAYFALSWYYTWDVPFAEGQMLGDLGLKTRGWGNVSAENNHIDVFVFDFADVLRWLSAYYNEPRFSRFADVISTSMRQLLPLDDHLCGVGKSGFYPEVVQHTNWDYGRNGKGFYNTIFAPGWTVASLWELLSPGRAEHFFLRK